MGIVGVATFIGFLLGCISTNMAQNNASDIYDLQHKKTTSDDCKYGDIIFGEEIHGTKIF